MAIIMYIQQSILTSARFYINTMQQIKKLLPAGFCFVGPIVRYTNKKFPAHKLLYNYRNKPNY